VTSNVARLGVLGACLFALLVPLRASAQNDAPRGAALPAAAILPVGATPLTIDVGTETESYLRYLQSLSAVPLSQWTIRSFGPREVDALLARSATAEVLRSHEHPVHAARGMRWQVSPVVIDGWYNSSFPFGENDGAVWRGRGLTVAAQGGIAARYGALSVSIEPVAFWAQNQDFVLMANRQVGPLAYGDALRPTTIDRPQRFGAEPYARLDPGQSTVRVDAFGLALGVSTANQWWGPMSEWPYLLSNNAAGFPHLFAGSSAPWNVGIGRLHGRVIYGRLEQSDYTGIVGSARHRFAAGLVGSFMPRGVPGLEIGAARMFEMSWPAGGIGWRDLRKPFEAFLKANVAGDPGEPSNSSMDNQLASLFTRWVFPGNGLEVYAEYGREDHNWDTSDLLQEPDHSATLGLGFRKAWRRPDQGLSGLRAELFDLDPSTLGRNRTEGSIYVHSDARQGHTERGQVLGAGFAAINGVGSMLAYERYGTDESKLLLSMSRMVVRERAATTTLAGAQDVQYALTAERTRRMGTLAATLGLTGVFELGRYFQGSVGNLLVTTRLAW
jgi:hypothetical protein